jgi:hypothetical protein
MNSDFVHGHSSELDHKTTGRWSREEHEKFIVGMPGDFHPNTRYILLLRILAYILLLLYSYISSLILIHIYSYVHIWEGLEESGVAYRHKVWCLNPQSCPEVLQSNRKRAWTGYRTIYSI